MSYRWYVMPVSGQDETFALQSGGPKSGRSQNDYSRTGSSGKRVGKNGVVMALQSLYFPGFVRMQGAGKFGTIRRCPY
ncbi:MAG: hypothetical protein ACREU3_14965, partial [Steroidobacteraceae bacterium]